MTDNPTQFALPGQQSLPTNSQTSSTEQGLNYIDLDLANKESPHLGLDGPSGSQAPSRLFSVLGGGSGVGGVSAAVSSSSSSSSSLNTYASIDFYKSEELRTHQSGSKEGTGESYLFFYFNTFVGLQHHVSLVFTQTHFDLSITAFVPSSSLFLFLLGLCDIFRWKTIRFQDNSMEHSLLFLLVLVMKLHLTPD